LQSDFDKESMATEYPFKSPLKKIAEENEDHPYKSSKRKQKTELSSKRGKSLNYNAIRSNGFTRSGINNSTSYQSNFNDAAFSTSTSKHFLQSPLTTIENKKVYQRSDSLIARSSVYSSIPCPHCDRKFSNKAAERHIPICKSIINKPTTLRKSSKQRSSVQLPHLSQTNYNKGFEHNLMNNTSSTFLTSASKPIADNLSKTHDPGLPPTHKSKAGGSKKMNEKQRGFAAKR
jgi:hypothetical protein